MRFFLFAAVAGLALPAVSFGQIQLFAFDGTTETPLSALYDAGSVAVGDSAELRIRVRNVGSTANSIQSIGLAGSGFTITARPTLPYVLAPGAAADIRVGFTGAAVGAYSASFTVNSLTVFLRITATFGVELAQEINGVRVVVPGGATIDMGRQQRGLKLSQTLYLHNPGSVPLRV
ncbi:MAG: choice-of-anchor D domain-containing protein, partial [Bryobacteraceae bacterium]